MILVVAILVGAPSWAQDAEGPDLSGPRAALTSFLDAMNDVRGDHPERLRDALACLELEGPVTPEIDPTHVKSAQQLFDILDSGTVPLSTTPETAADGENAVTVTVDCRRDDELVPFDVVIRQGDDGLWRITSDTLERVPEVHVALAAESAEDEPAADTGPKLGSPRETMRTFIEGVNRWDEGGDQNALAALDLSAIDETLRYDLGKEFGLLLMRILDRHSKVVYQNIDNDPAGPPYVHLTHSAGNIVITPIDNPETGFTEWKFSQATLENLLDLWDAFKEKEIVVEGKDETGEPVVLSMLIRDWVGGQFPFLLNRTAMLENWHWVGLFLIIFVGMALSRVAGFLILLGIRRWFAHSKMSLSQKLQKDFVRPIRIALMAWVWFIALGTLNLPPDALKYLRIIAITVSAAGGVWAAYRLIDIVSEYLAERAARTPSKFDDVLIPLVTRSLKLLVVVFGIVFVAEVAGFRPTSVLAGLGLGGLAFALAAKDTIANVFGSITILVDRPFQIGDWIVTGDVEGSVEAVGIRSTRVRTFYNSLITVPNSALINATIDNMGARRYRRIKTMLCLTYDTPPEKIEAFCEGIRELIRQHPYTRKDYYHVWLNEFADASLNILLYCFHEAPEWATELRERHRLFLDIIRLAQRLGVEFAFPTQTLYVRQDQVPEGPGAPSVDEAFVLGQREATRIVDEFLGGRDAPKPPPVTMEGPRDDQDTPLRDAKLGGDGPE